MCGFAGFHSFDSQWREPGLFKKLSEVLFHRGPDDYGIFTSDMDSQNKITQDLSISPSVINLLHRRLSIIDLSENGRQPISTPCGRWTIIFNGEIYNYKELAEELRKLGYTFRSESDTEVLLYSFVEWKTDCLPKLVGMFSFAIFDNQTKTITLARDHFGIKPLFFTSNQSGFAFASEVKALLALPSISRNANPQVVYEFLVNGRQEHAGNTFFTDINEVEPGHTLTYSIEKKSIVSQRAYWKLHSEENAKITKKDAAQTLETLFTDSVRLHLRSDVPVCATLSGGIDSSSIVMAIRNIVGTKSEINTVSFIANEKAICEEPWIDIVNAAAKTKPHKVNVGYEDLLTDIDDLIFTQEQPFGSTSPIAQYNVFKKINDLGFKVVLDGQGADEMLGGYRSYLYAYLLSLVKRKKYLSSGVLAFNIAKLPGVSGSLMTILKHAIACRKILNTGGGPTKATSGPSWMSQDWMTNQQLLAHPSWSAKSNNALKENLHVTFTQYSLPHLLRVQDRNSMRFSIESRVPFLNPNLVDFIFSLPESYLIDLYATTKSIFRDAMRSSVPPEILSRKDKVGFSTPEETWLRTHSAWVHDTFNSDIAHQIPCINLKELNAEWEQFLSGKTHFCWRFWRWINLIKWTEQFSVTYSN